ncbi:MAG: FtsX-like permease family protein [Bacteroidota bacterium]
MLLQPIRLLFRNLGRNKTFSALNIFGLATGIACASFIFLWVEHELSFNHQFSKRKTIYALMQSGQTDGKTITEPTVPILMPADIISKFPEIKSIARIGWDSKQLFILGDKMLTQQGQYCDPSVLSILDFNFIYGTHPSIAAVNTIVISESMAVAFFGHENPVGKVIASRSKAPWTKDGDFMITGVFKDFAENCSYHFNWISSFTIYDRLLFSGWNKWAINMPTIIEAAPHADIAGLNKKLKHYMASKLEGSTLTTFVSPMDNWNLYSQYTDGKPVGGKIQYIYLFSIIAVLILVIACINFMNLSTARSEKRAKEVGVRKVSGASRRQLVRQFMLESLLMSFLSLCAAMLLITLLMPAFNMLTGKTLQPDLFKPMHQCFLVGIGVTCGLLSGAYPAFYLSSFKPIIVLKGLKMKSGIAAVLMRKGLVVTQFTISIVLIVATIIIYQQVNHIKSRNLGYNINNMMEVIIPQDIGNHFTSIRTALLKTGAVENVALSWNPPLQMNTGSDEYTWQGKPPASHFQVYDMGVSAAYIATMKMTLKTGRDFYEGETVDSNKTVIINETMAKLMGAEGRIGATINRKGFPGVQVIGIVSDFIFNDLYGSGGPVMMVCMPGAGDHMIIRFKNGTNPQKAQNAAASVLNAGAPGYVFEYKYVDDGFNKIFETETLIGKLVTVFSILAIVISCLGLFGLASYTAERRTKEIGIRKVLGATITSLVTLLSYDFLKLVLISCVIAFPFAWYALHAWLQDYAYRTSIQWWPFATAGAGALLIALLTVSFQAIKAAAANPVKSLRSE